MLLAQSETISWTGALVMAVAVGLLMIGSGWGAMALADRTADGRVGRTSIAGIRTKATLASDEAWLAAHKAGRRATKFGGGLFAASGLIPIIVGVLPSLFGSGDANDFVVIWAVLLLVGTIVGTAAVAYGAVVGNRAAGAVVQPERTI